MSAIVKPILEDRAYRKAGMPDYQNVETIAAIPRVEYCDERDFDLYRTRKCKFAFYSPRCV